jgi:outer membrane protein TolC
VLLSKYANYKAALADLAAISAMENFNIGFEAKALRPFAGSGYDSDESIGLVARKTLFSGGMIESQILEAQAIAEATLAEVEAAYRQGVSVVKSAQQSRESLQKSVNMARENKEITADEIVYLRQQLIIGGSTLDSVLSAEARLYDAESKEIMLKTEKLKAELLIAGALGLLGPAFDMNK